ncbi:hypothetical protein LO762_23300 [Actinocorallia sp. API 0066]|uniref:hypothetical protein n=1 Tax=Actinocorallia sp. API 0066 TaxID=2896846 RepID=UPI001E45962A|nr:hypothetical protein [Actinocorallia sp. API 0066]MCD0452097.1 hypothetical protein [Actinocorallia sp. API 0066]
MRSLCVITAALVLLAAPAASAAPATDGMVVPLKVVEAGGQAVDVQMLYSCSPPGESAWITFLLGQASAGTSRRVKGPWGKVRTKVDCGTLRRHTVRIPILKDGPILPGAKAVITAEMYNSAGARIHTATSTKKVTPNKKGGAGPFGLFNSLMPRRTP